MRTRALIIDDHAVVRAGIRRLLEHEPGVEAIAEAATMPEALVQARAMQPTLVTLDVLVGETNSLEALPQLLEAAPGAKVLVLSMYDDPAYVRQAMRAGALGYIVKDAVADSFIDALRIVCHGGRYLEPDLAARVLADPGDEAAAVPDPLSGRERDVTRLLALGHTNREIAEQLQLSPRTVEVHRANAARKLQVHSRAELVRYALAAGLLEPEPQARATAADS